MFNKKAELFPAICTKTIRATRTSRSSATSSAKERINSNLFSQDLYADLYSVILTLKIEDLVNVSSRRADKTTLFEVKNIFAMVYRQFVPDAYLDQCLRGVNADNVPMYYLQSAYVHSGIRTLTYYENSFDRLTAAANNITLYNTVFYNIHAV